MENKDAEIVLGKIPYSIDEQTWMELQQDSVFYGISIINIVNGKANRVLPTSDEAFDLMSKKCEEKYINLSEIIGEFRDSLTPEQVKKIKEINAEIDGK